MKTVRAETFEALIAAEKKGIITTQERQLVLRIWDERDHYATTASAKVMDGFFEREANAKAITDRALGAT